jgi:hypothetical protein
MAEKYFEKFPIITYANTTCRNLTRRVKIVENPRESPYIFYPYEITDHLRSDHVAEYYYEDSELDWMIYHSNQIIDPYYDWYINDDQFEQLIKYKYGSIENSQKKIIHYQNNWADDDNELTPSFYNNTLANTHKDFYAPVWSPISKKIVSYKRKQQDKITNTNRILQYTIANSSSNAFISGEIIDIKTSGQDATAATGEVIFANTTTMRIKNVSGNTIANTSLIRDIVGETSFANAQANSVTTMFENIPLDQEIFYDAITYYEYELGKNENNKTIKLIGDGVASIAADNFATRLAEDSDQT